MTLILLSIIATTLVFMLGLWFGWHLRELGRQGDKIVHYITTKLQPKQPEPPKPTATVIDPSDPVQRAKYERDQMMGKINGPEIKE